MIDMGISYAIDTIIQGIDEWIHAAEIANQKMEESVVGYNNAKTQSESANTDLSTINQRISELQNKGTLTFVEQTELDKLKEVTNELEKQAAYYERKTNTKAIEALRSASEAYETSYGQYDISKENTAYYKENYQNNVKAGLASNPGYLYDDKGFDLSGIIAYKELNKQLRSDAESAGDTEEVNKLEQNVQKADIALSNALLKLQDYKNSFNSVPMELWTNGEKGQYQEIINDLDYIWQYVDSNEWKHFKIEDILSLDAFDGVKEKLIQLSKAAGQNGITINDLKKNYPLLASAINDTGINLKEFVDDINNQAYAATLGKSALQIMEDEFSSFQSKAVEMINAMDTINAALANSISGKGLNVSFDADTGELTGDIANIQAAYQSLEGYNPEVLFERTANGVHLNRKALRLLQDEQKTIQKQNFLAEQTELSQKLTIAQKELEGAIDKENDTSGIQSTISYLQSKLETVLMLSSAYDGATSAYQKWIDAQSNGEEGDMYDAITSTALTRGQELFEQGKVGTEEFRAIADLFSNQDLSTASVEEVTSAYQSALPLIQQYFTEGKEGSIAFAEALEEMGYAYKDANDNFVFNPADTEDIAEKLGIDAEAVEAIFKKIIDYGGDITFINSDDIDQLETLEAQAKEAQESLRNLSEENESLSAATNFNIEDLDTVDELEDKMEELNEIKSTLNLDSEQAELLDQLLEAIQAKIDHLNDSEANPDITLDTAQAAFSTADELVNRIQQIQNTNAHTDLNIDINGDTQVQQLAEQLAALPPELKTSIGIDGEADAQAIIDQIVNNPSSINIPVTSNTSDAENDIVAVANTYIPNKNVTVTADTSSAGIAIASLKGMLNTLYDKTITITTQYITHNLTFPTPPSSGTGTYFNGTAHHLGTAPSIKNASFANGNWGLQKSERALTGELGPEIVVRDGKFFTVGNIGAELVRLKQGDIIFNHKQTEGILKNGYITSRGKLIGGSSFVYGSAYGSTTASGSWNPHLGGGGSSSSSTSSNTSSTSGYSSPSNYVPTPTSYSDTASTIKDVTDAADDFSETIDWIETKLDRLERGIDRISETAESAYETFSIRNGALAEELRGLSDEITIQQQAYNSYMQAAASVGLSPDWAAKVQNGFIDIQTITDEDLNDRIQEYQKWYEKALDCKDAIDDLILSVQDLYQERFDLVEQEYDGILGQLQARSDLLDAYIDQTETRGWLLSAEYHTDMMETEQQILTHLQKERGALSDALNQAVAAGQIAEYSEAWYDMKDTINDVSQSIIESQTNLLDFANSIRELNWDRFDLLQDKISDIQEESEFLMELLEAGTLFDEQGNFNDAGKAKAGLLAVSYQTYKAQAEQYAQELAKLDQELQSDPYNQTLIDRRQELLELQRESISAAESEKEAIRDLVEDGIKAQLDALEDLIERYTDMLDAEQDAYDYQKRVQKQQEEISALEKQLAAYTGDDSEEGRLKRQELQTSLKEARSDLADTQYDQRMDDTKKLLDELYTEYETILNQRLDSMEQLVTDVISGVTQEAGQIRDTISSEAAKAGYTLTQAMQTIWGNDGAVGTALGAIQASLEAMAAAAKKEADANIHEAEQSVTPAPQPAPAPVPQPAPQPEASSGDFFIYKKDTYWKDRLQRNTSIVDALKYHNFDSSFEARSMYYSKMGLSGIYTGSASQNLQMISWLRAHGYKNGVKNVPSAGLFWTNEGAPETILRKSDGALLTKLDTGDMVLNHAARDNFWNLMNHPDTFLGRLMPHALSGTTPSFSSTSDVNVSMSFVLPGVKNYDELMTAVRTDPKFEKFIQEITLGRMNGHGKLTKNRLN